MTNQDQTTGPDAFPSREEIAAASFNLGYEESKADLRRVVAERDRFVEAGRALAAEVDHLKAENMRLRSELGNDLTEQDEPTTTTDLRKAAALLRATPALVVGSVPLAAWLDSVAEQTEDNRDQVESGGSPYPVDGLEHALAFARELLTHTTGKATT